MQPLPETKTTTENALPSRISYATMLIEPDIPKGLWILLDEVSCAQVNLTSMDFFFLDDPKIIWWCNGKLKSE